MALTDDQRRQFQQWLNEKGVKTNCPACGARRWATGDIVAPPVRVGRKLKVGGDHVPLVQLICGHCGHVMHFAAKIAGLATELDGEDRFPDQISTSDV